MSDNSFVRGLLLVIAVSVGAVLAADSGFISWQDDGSVRIGKPKPMSGYAIQNPLGSRPSVSDFFGSLKLPAPPMPSDGVITQSGQCDEYGQNCVTYPPQIVRPVPRTCGNECSVNNPPRIVSPVPAPIGERI